MVVFNFCVPLFCGMQMNVMTSPGLPSFCLGEYFKVLSLLEACFDLISGSSLHKESQIMGGKITENLGFKSPLWKVKCLFVLFSVHFQILHTKVDIFYLDQFLISFLINKTRYQKVVKIKDIHFCVKNLKMKRKKNNFFLTFQSGKLNPIFSVIFSPMIWIFMESEEPKIKSRQSSKRDKTLTLSQLGE